MNKNMVSGRRQVRPLTLMQIRYFLEVCKTGSFTKAAQNLFVSQSSLSRQIQLLLFSPKLFPQGGYPENVTQFSGKTLVKHKDSINNYADRVQKEVLKQLGVVPGNCIFVDSLVPALLYDEAETGFGLYVNNHLTKLNYYPVSEDIATISLIAVWKKENPLPFADFFDMYYG